MSNNNVPFHKDVLEKCLPTEKVYCIKDKKVSSLQLLVYPSGVKTFILLRKVNGNSSRIKIGRLCHLSIEQARNKAKEVNSAITLGADPQKEKREARNALTLKELYDIYYKEHAAKNTKRPNENKRTMEINVFPSFGNKVANNISSQEMKVLYRKLADKQSPYSKKDNIKDSRSTAVRILNVISAVFNYGIKEELISCINPCSSIKKPQLASRDRFLNFEEMKKFLDALENEEQIYQDVFKILLYTGARKTNVLKMKWSEVDISINQWRLPETKTKNKDINIVSLNNLAIEILKARKIANEALLTPSEFVFAGTGTNGHLVNIRKSFNRIKARMNVDDIVIHDLRRTLGSYMAINGASLLVIGKALNHKSQASTAIYARLLQDPILEASNNATELMHSFAHKVA